MKKYNSYKDYGVEWIGEIPEHWVYLKVGYISKLLTGNPWKSLVSDLQKSGADTEVCGGRMKELGVGNADLLPSVKVDTDGWLRVMELQSKGYTLFQT